MAHSQTSGHPSWALPGKSASCSPPSAGSLPTDIPQQLSEGGSLSHSAQTWDYDGTQSRRLRVCTSTGSEGTVFTGVEGTVGDAGPLQPSPLPMHGYAPAPGAPAFSASYNMKQPSVGFYNRDQQGEGPTGASGARRVGVGGVDPSSHVAKSITKRLVAATVCQQVLDIIRCATPDTMHTGASP